MSRNIIFDVDGTLFRTETVDVAAFNQVLSDFGYEQKSQKEILDLIGYPMDEICRRLLGNVPKQLVTGFSERVTAYELELIPQSGFLYPGVVEVLSLLKMQGHHLFACSSGGGDYIVYRRQVQ